jgi:hypothetical protein
MENTKELPQFGTKEFNTFFSDLCDKNLGGKPKQEQEISYSLDEIKTAMKNGYGIKTFSEHTFLKNLSNLKKK